MSRYIMKKDVRTFHVRLFTDIIICIFGFLNVAFEGVLGAMATILVMNTVFIIREVLDLADFKEYWYGKDIGIGDTRGGEEVEERA